MPSAPPPDELRMRSMRCFKRLPDAGFVSSEEWDVRIVPRDSLQRSARERPSQQQVCFVTVIHCLPTPRCGNLRLAYMSDLTLLWIAQVIKHRRMRAHLHVASLITQLVHADVPGLRVVCSTTDQSSPSGCGGSRALPRARILPVWRHGGAVIQDGRTPSRPDIPQVTRKQ